MPDTSAARSNTINYAARAPEEPGAAGSGPPRWRVRVLATAITLAAFLALFVGLEYGYRYFVIGSLRLEPFMWADDPDLLYRLDPSNPLFPSSFRGKAPGATKDAEHLVICMGGSTTFGFRVSTEEAWPHVVELLLRARGIGAEVINAGVDGYGMRQQLVRYRRDIAQLKPAAVVIYEGWNRCGRLVDPLCWAPLGVPGGRSEWVRQVGLILARRSMLAKRVFQHFAELNNEWHRHDWVMDPYHDIWIAELRTLVKEMNDRGQRPVLVVCPSLFYEEMTPDDIALYEPSLWERGTYKPEMLEEFRRKHAAIRTVAAENGALLIDVQEAFASYRGRKRLQLFFDQMHPTVAGNRKIGEVIGRALASQLFGAEDRQRVTAN